jgi:branched-subunit amino acid transport protein
MTALLTVLAGGLGSYLLRMSMIATDRVRLPERVEDTVTFVAPAAFTSLVVTSLAATVTAAPAPQFLAPLAAAAVAVFAAARTGSAHAAILCGMPTLWLLAAVTS